MRTKYLATIYAIGAAALYAINVPFSKMLLGYVEPTMMAAFLYLGAGVGLFIYDACFKGNGQIRCGRTLDQKRTALHHRNGSFGHHCAHPSDAGHKDFKRGQRFSHKQL